MIFYNLIYLINSKIYLEERFNSGWEERWKKPEIIKKGVLLGKFRLSAGNFFADENLQRGLETLDSRRYYLLYSNFSESFDTRQSDLIIQYTVRLDMYVDCSGEYIKIFGPPANPNTFSNETFYSIMFGPDVCGATLHQTKVYIGYNGEYYPIKKKINCYKDHLTHAYTLIIRKNHSIEIKIDGETIISGLINKLFDVPIVSQIPDPNSFKPINWDDNEFIIDINDKKPIDWVDEQFIEDPDAFRPPSWDDSIEWAPPMIKNPDYIGEWKPKLIPNPNFKGYWKPNLISVDPIFDPSFGHFPSLTFLGIDLFQSCPGSILSNFLITDDEKYAEEVLKEVFLNIRTAEIKNFDLLADRLQKEKEIERLRNEKDMDHIKKLDAISSDPNLIDENEGSYKKVKRQMKLKEKKLKKKESSEFDIL